jgi:hypothetical protein
MTVYEGEIWCLCTFYLWPLDKKVQNWIVARSTGRDYVYVCWFSVKNLSNFISLPLNLTTHIAIFRSCALISMVWSESYKRIIILNAWQSKTQQKSWICNVWYIFLHFIRILWEYHSSVLKRVKKSNWFKNLKAEEKKNSNKTRVFFKIDKGG